MNNTEYLRQLCNAISEWRYFDEVQKLSKSDLLFELGKLAFLCIEDEATSNEAMKLWDIEKGFCID